MKNKWIINMIRYTFLSIASFFSIFPFYWMICSATNSTPDILRGKLSFGSALLNNIKILGQVMDMKNAFFNTTKITLIAGFLAILVTSMAGYGFATYRSKIYQNLLSLVVLSMMVPFSALMIPLFQLVSRIGLMNSYGALILPVCGSTFLIFFFTQNFKSYPFEIIEAARTDGASELAIFFKVVIPSMKSTFAAASIWIFMNQWNNYMWPLIVIQSEEKKTLTLAISSFSKSYFVEYGAMMVALLTATFPVLIVFLCMQKHFVEGIIGSNK